MKNPGAGKHQNEFPYNLNTVHPKKEQEKTLIYKTGKESSNREKIKEKYTSQECHLARIIMNDFRSPSFALFENTSRCERG